MDQTSRHPKRKKKLPSTRGLGELAHLRDPSPSPTTSSNLPSQDGSHRSPHSLSLPDRPRSHRLVSLHVHLFLGSDSQEPTSEEGRGGGGVSGLGEDSRSSHQGDFKYLQLSCRCIEAD